MSGISSPPAISNRGISFPIGVPPGFLFWRDDLVQPFYYDGLVWHSFSPGAPGPHGSTHVFTGSDPVPFIEQLESLYDCDILVAVGDVVYQDAASHVDLASNDDLSKMPAVGIVRSKPTATTAIVVTRGWYSALLGLVVGKVWVSIGGALTNTPPTPPAAKVSQIFGIVKSATDLQVAIRSDITL